MSEAIICSVKVSMNATDDLAAVTLGIEYKTHFITKLVGGNPYYGCYLLAAAIFGLGILRDYL